MCTFLSWNFCHTLSTSSSGDFQIRLSNEGGWDQCQIIKECINYSTLPENINCVLMNTWTRFYESARDFSVSNMIDTIDNI